VAIMIAAHTLEDKAFANFFPRNATTQQKKNDKFYQHDFRKKLIF